jgi:hypothetical protein
MGHLNARKRSVVLSVTFWFSRASASSLQASTTGKGSCEGKCVRSSSKISKIAMSIGSSRWRRSINSKSNRYCLPGNVFASTYTVANAHFAGLYDSFNKKSTTRNTN